MTARTRLALHAGVATLLGASALAPLFDSLQWLPPVAGAIAVVVLVSEGLRLLRAPAAIGPLAAALGVTSYLSWLYARSEAGYGFLPGPAALRALGRLLHDGMHNVGELAAPVPVQPDLVLLAVIGLAAVALVVDLLAVTLRRPALTGLPLVTVLAVSAAIAPHGAGWLPFALSSGGYLSLLLTDARDRVGRWGRTFGAQREGRISILAGDPQPSQLTVLARRIGLGAIGVAVVVPTVIPGLHEGLRFGTGSGNGTGNGGSSTVQTFNPIVRIRDELNTRDPVPVLRVRTDDPDPAYLRMISLDQFNGAEWSPSELTATERMRTGEVLPAPPVTANVPARQVHSEVQSVGLDVHWLPIPYAPVAVQVDGDWRYHPASATVFSARRSTRNLTYRTTSAHVDVTPAELLAAPAPERTFGYTSLPTNLPQDIVELARNVTRGETTTYGKAVAIQTFLTSDPFVYDRSAPAGNGENALEEFLFVTHRGFCEQYAAAMAVMTRALGIPTRVAIGFTRGEEQGDGSWLVTTHEAHAWPEIYFGTIGWLPFEPTPRGDGQAVTPSYTVQAPGPGPQPSASAGVEVSGTPTAAPGPNGKQRDLERQGAGRGAQAPQRHGPSPWWLLLALPLLAAMPSATRLVRARRRWSGATDDATRAHAAWAQLRDDARDLRLPWVASDTPRTSATRLVTAGSITDDEAVAALQRVARAEERASYARPGTVGDTAGLHADVAAVRGHMRRSATRGARWRARLLPVSGLLWMSAGGERLADLLDAADAGVATARARVAGGVRGVLRRA